VEREAAGQELATAERRLKEMARKTQVAVERKQRRDAAGARKGAKGDMPRILIGARRDQAERSGGDAARLAERQRAEAAGQAEAARARIEIMEGLSVSLPPSGVASGQRIVVLDHVTAGYGNLLLLRDFDLTVAGPERIALTGPNGSGKSTLLRIIAGQVQPLSGRVERPADCALLDQQVSLLDPASSIAANFARLHPGATENAARAALARFRFRADAALQLVGTLSGGQLLRAGLACVLGGETVPQLLLLDEPTNHLDMDSIEVLEAALAGYDGALLVVSHDRAFLEAIGVAREIALA
jgi:ATPase subunit of ABC transporter with duplicated ATPase domains